MKLHATSRPVELSPQPAVARRELRRLLTSAAWDGDIDNVILAVHEAMVNAQRHAGGVAEAMLRFDGSTVVVEVSDRGDGFDLPRGPEVPDTGAEGGRGLYLIRRLTADASVVRAGPVVRLVLSFTREDGEGFALLT